MDDPPRKKPSCMLMVALFAVLAAVLAWALSGTALRTPHPVSTTSTPATDQNQPVR
jgi:hypothetical protein